MTYYTITSYAILWCNILLYLGCGSVISACDRSRRWVHGPGLLAQMQGLAAGFRKGTNGVSTNGATAFVCFFDRGTIWVPICQHLSTSVNICQHLSTSVNFANCFSPIWQNCITFAATPCVSTPFVRSQGFLAGRGGWSLASRPR